MTNTTPDLELFFSAQSLPVHEKFTTMNMVASVVIGGGFLAAAVIAFLALSFSKNPPHEMVGKVVYSAIALWTLLSVAYHWLADRKIRYASRPQDVVMQKGLFFRAVTCQPIKRIQHVEIKQGPIERLFHLFNVNIYSAGGSSHTFRIPGLDKATANSLRIYLLEHADISAD